MNTKKRILLLEDSAEIALLIKHWIRSDLGDEVVHVTDLPQAMELLVHESWDVMITDIELPSGNCFEILGYAKQAHPNLQILVMTSHQRADYAVEALRLKADEFLFKPFQKPDFLQKIVALSHSLKSTAAKRSILAIGAHPDDVEIGCGGSLRAHVLAGATVHVLTLSMGEAGGQRHIREAESFNAAQILGASLTTANLPDTRINEGADTIAVIEEVIGRVQPSIIYTHSEHDAHQDHRNTFRATVVAARRVPTLLCYQAPSSTIDFRPTRFTEITGCLDAKMRAIMAYPSQATQRPYMARAMIEATARYWGRFAGYGLCEPFEAIRELSS
jgi:two-component system response regulator HydG